MKGLFRRFFAASTVTLIGTALLFSNGPTHAETQRERCRNVATTAHYFASERDKGVSSKEIGRRIKTVLDAGELTENEFLAMHFVAGMIYTDYKNMAPEKIRQMYLSQCR